MMPVNVNDVFMAGNPETLKHTKENIKKQFYIQESREAKKFLGVYYGTSDGG